MTNRTSLVLSEETQVRRVLRTACRLGVCSAEFLALDGTSIVSETANVCDSQDDQFVPHRSASVPILRDGTQLGSLRMAGPFQNDLFLEQMANYTAERIADAWGAVDEIDSLAREVVNAYEELHLLYDLAKVLTGKLTVNEVAVVLLEHLVTTLHSDLAELKLLGADERTVQHPAKGLDPRPVDEDHSIRTNLLSGGNLLGTLEMVRLPTNEPFDSGHSKLLNAIGTLAGSSIRNAQLFDAVNGHAVALRERESYLSGVLDSVADGIITLNGRGRINSFNPAAERILGWRADEIIDRHFRALMTQNDPGVLRGLRKGASSGHVRPGTILGLRKDGSSFPMEMAVGQTDLNGDHLYIISFRDITERLQAEEALHYQALHDQLTNLPNRTMLNTLIDEEIAKQEPNGSLALLVMDLDRFKDVNDTFGHDYGDELLKQIGPRLNAALGDRDVVARLGGDEFAIVLPNTNRDGAAQVARRLSRALDLPFTTEGRRFAIGASIGIALFPEHGNNAGALLRRADVAMYAAKSVRGSHAVYQRDQDENSPFRLALLGDLRKAIETDELVLHYQPKVSLSSQLVTSAEALVRWNHPQHGLLSPDKFIPLAEQTGLIDALSLWVLNTSLRDAADWRRRGQEMKIAVNLSARNLRDAHLANSISDMLSKWGLPPSALIIEITESTLMSDGPRAKATLGALNAMGVRVSIDDFGTGYSSLAYLRTLPVSELKIDRSFVAAVADDQTDAAIVRSTIDLGHALGLVVVAEGIEDQRTWDVLHQLGCDTAQGYFISRPKSACDLTTWLGDATWGANPSRLGGSPSRLTAV